MKSPAGPALFVVAALLLPVDGYSKEKKPKQTPPGHQPRAEAPRGHAKRGCLPPGLAKKHGKKGVCSTYVLVDPRKPDQAWFLIGSEWVLRANFEAPVRDELTAALRVELPPPPPPPIPLPRVEAKLEILFFE